MSEEKTTKNNLMLRDFFAKLVALFLIGFLIVWLLPIYIASPVITNAKEGSYDVSPLTSQIYADNLERMKDAAISYYTDERLPQSVGESDTMTLSDMIGKKLLVPLIDKNNKPCDVSESYVKITKLDNEYLLKVYLKDSEREDYILVHLGCYTYCDSYICEKEETTITGGGSSKPSEDVPIKDGVDDTVYDEGTTDTPSKPSNPDVELPDPDDGDTPVEVPDKVKGYLYEYQKNQGASFTNWSSWSNWSKTSCSTEEINCNDKDPDCVKKLQRFDRKEQIGTYSKKYEKKRQVLTKTGSYQQKSCSKFNYYIINDTTYATTTTTTYNVVKNVITSVGQSSGGGWVYNGRASYKNPPRDTATTQYKFVGADYSYCEDTCTTLPNYYYDSYVYRGGGSGLSTVTSTTTVPGQTSSSTSSSSSSSVSVSCGEVVTKTIPIYDYITVSEIATRQEPLYGTVCYQSTKTRKLIDAGKTMTKWSKYNDKELLNNGWYYTGYKKPIK